MKEITEYCIKRQKNKNPIRKEKRMSVTIECPWFAARDSCNSDQVRCGDGRCLPLSAKCNGIAECIDGVDEYDCGKGESF